MSFNRICPSFLSLVLLMSLFNLCCWDEIPRKKKQLREERPYFSAQFQDTVCNCREVTLWSDGWYFNGWSVWQPQNRWTPSHLGPQSIRPQMRSWSGVLPNVNSHSVEIHSHVDIIKHTCPLTVAMDSQVLGWWVTAGLARRTCGPCSRKGQRLPAMQRPQHSQLPMKLPRQQACDERGTNTVSSPPLYLLGLPTVQDAVSLKGWEL